MSYFGYLGGNVFGDFLELMKDLGMFDYVFPFLLYFAIIYGLLEQLKIFGKSESSKRMERLNFIISLSMSFLILAYVPGATTIGEILAELLQKWALLAMGFLLIPLFLAIFKIDMIELFKTDDNKISSGAWALVIIMFLVVVVIFYNTLGYRFPEFWVYIDKKYIGLVVVVGLIIGLILYMGSEDEEVPIKKKKNNNNDEEE